MNEKKLSFVSGFIYQNETDNHSFGVYTQLKNQETITLKEAADIYNRVKTKLLKDGEFIKSIKIDLTKYAEYLPDGRPQWGSEEKPSSQIGPEIHARYHVKENMLRIWQNDLPIYENRNGVICKDRDALADCLL
jgi:hypothetical protein